jgi:FkbM family methyltransferase
MNEPFGSLAPTRAQERVRKVAHALPGGYVGRKAASLLMGSSGAKARRAYDVTVFGTQRARLHPYDNICERRVFLTPRLWDHEERMLLARVIAGYGGRTLYFVDVGANVGLYTLFARAQAQQAGAKFRALCIEADPDMQERLAFNLAASGAAEEAEIIRCAVADREGVLRFSVNHESRGMSRLDGAGALEVAARPLARIIDGARLPQIDVLKMDIEGAELPALASFFAEARREIWPKFLMLETSHETREKSAAEASLAAGYRLRLETRLNAILELP